MPNDQPVENTTPRSPLLMESPRAGGTHDDVELGRMPTEGRQSQRALLGTPTEKQKEGGSKLSYSTRPLYIFGAVSTAVFITVVVLTVMYFVAIQKDFFTLIKNGSEFGATVTSQLVLSKEAAKLALMEADASSRLAENLEIPGIRNFGTELTIMAGGAKAIWDKVVGNTAVDGFTNPDEFQPIADASVAYTTNVLTNAMTVIGLDLRPKILAANVAANRMVNTTNALTALSRQLYDQFVSDFATPRADSAAVLDISADLPVQLQQMTALVLQQFFQMSQTLVYSGTSTTLASVMTSANATFVALGSNGMGVTQAGSNSAAVSGILAAMAPLMASAWADANTVIGQGISAVLAAADAAKAGVVANDDLHMLNVQKGISILKEWGTKEGDRAKRIGIVYLILIVILMAMLIALMGTAVYWSTVRFRAAEKMQTELAGVYREADIQAKWPMGRLLRDAEMNHKFGRFCQADGVGQAPLALWHAVESLPDGPMPAERYEEIYRNYLAPGCSDKVGCSPSLEGKLRAGLNGAQDGKALLMAAQREAETSLSINFLRDFLRSYIEAKTKGGSMRDVSVAATAGGGATVASQPGGASDDTPGSPGVYYM